MSDTNDRDALIDQLVARLLSAGHGGQILLSLPTEELVRDTLPEFVSLQDLGAHRLRDLDRAEMAFQLLHPDLPADFPPLKSLDNPDLPNNLPQQVTSFIGREKEILETKRLLAGTHLLTLTGSGGAGKTRLSLQVAAEILEEYPDGVWLVELAPLADPELVPQTVASVLGVIEQKGKTFAQLLTDHLKAKRVLLLLDNCEHVLSACAHLTDTLIRSCPHLKILASSREGLGIAGEQTYRIPSMSLPDLKQSVTVGNIEQYESVRLFIERALLNKTDFVVSRQNAPALASVCHRLDGIPLAIELAAARVRSLTVEEINSKLDNRFRLLTGGSKTALPRQQTLAAAIGWSYDLLNPHEKTLLARLSVFQGGWTLEAAEAVGTCEEVEAWEVLDLLSSLVDKSLVLAEDGELHTRYRLLETVRQYARDRLTQEEETAQAARQRHRDFFLKLAEEIRKDLLGPEQARCLNALEIEHDNMRLALRFCLEEPAGSSDREAQAGLRLGAVLWWFWYLRGHLSEGREHLNALLTGSSETPATAERATVLYGVCVLSANQGDYIVARSHAEECLRIRQEIGDKSGIAFCLARLGSLAQQRGEFETALSLCEESLAITREIGMPDGIANSLGNLANVYATMGNFEMARPLFEEAILLYRSLGMKGDTAAFLHNLGMILTEQGDYARASSLLEEALSLRRDVGDKLGIAGSLFNLGHLALSQGDHLCACPLYEESLEMRRKLGDKNGMSYCLAGLGFMADARGDFVLANSLLEEGLTIAREIGLRDNTAYCLVGLGSVASNQGDFAAARVRLTESLTISSAIGNAAYRVFCLEELAFLAQRGGQEARAGRLWGAAEVWREGHGVPMPSADHERYRPAIAATRALLGEEAFTRAWAEGRALTLEQATTYALDNA